MHRTAAALVLACATLLAAGQAAGQSTASLPRVGFCSPGIPESQLVDYKHPIPQALLAGMRELGWHHEKNYRLIFRTAVGRPGGMPACIESLVKEPVDVIVVPGLASAAAERTGGIPVVGAIDGSEATSPHARDPRRKFTGIVRDEDQLWPKWFALLKEVAKVDRIVVVSPFESAPDVYPGLQKEKSDEMRRTERTVGVTLERWRLTSPQQIEGACAMIASQPRSGIVIGDSHVWVTWGPDSGKLIDEHCVTRHRLPILYRGASGASAPGILVGYGPNFAGVMRLLPHFIDRILKGAKPGDLPVRTAEDYQLGLNLTTARRLGITIPPSIMVRADVVFEEGQEMLEATKSRVPY